MPARTVVIFIAELMLPRVMSRVRCLYKTVKLGAVSNASVIGGKPLNRSCSLCGVHLHVYDD